jgi:hypothetical protein
MRYLIPAILCFALAVGFFMLIEGCTDPLPEREKIDGKVARLMEYHGTDTAYKVGGVWYFDRKGQRCRL